MNNRRIAQLAGAILISIGGVLGFAGAASAHNNPISATTSCVQGDHWHVNFKVENDFNLQANLTAVSPSGLPVIKVGAILPKDNNGPNTFLTDAADFPLTTNSFVYSVTAHWTDGFTRTNSLTVNKPQTCVTTTTTTTAPTTTTTTTRPTTTTTAPTTTTTVASTTTTTRPTTTTTVATTTTTQATTTTTAPTTTTTVPQETTTTTTRPTTTTTVGTTTTTVASTTTTVVPTTTTVAPTTTTVVETTTTVPVVTTAPGRFELAHTGSNPMGGITIGVTFAGVGVILLLAGRHARKYS